MLVYVALFGVCVDCYVFMIDVVLYLRDAGCLFWLGAGFLRVCWLLFVVCFVIWLLVSLRLWAICVLFA